MTKKAKNKIQAFTLDAANDGRPVGQLRILQAPQQGNNQRMPWQDKNGEPLHPGLLKQRSKRWSLKTWDRYCEYLDAQAGSLVESRISPKKLEEELEGMTYEIDECLEGPKDFSDLDVAMKSLNPEQRAVIEILFWAGQTIRETAEILGLPRSTVQDLKSSALLKLYAKIPDTSPLMRGKVVFSPKTERRKRAA